MTLQEFIKKTSFEVLMSGGGIDSYSNYSGFDYAGWLCGPSRSRDSDILAESNFQTALEMLGGEIEDQIEVRRVGHWACGWFEQIMVKATSPKAQELFEIHKSLKQYPVLDESDFSEREYESYYEYAKVSAKSVGQVLANLTGLDEETAESEEMIQVAIELNMNHQSENGGGSALYDNEYHEPDERNIQDYERQLNSWDVQAHLKDNIIFQYLLAAFNIEERK